MWKHTQTHTQQNLTCCFLWQHIRLYSQLRCRAARAQSTPRQLGSRKQYKIDMHAPLCFSEVCGAWMPSGAALLTQASLPHCNTGSLIRCNKRGNEVRQQGETLGKATERQDWSFSASTQRTMFFLNLNHNYVRAPGAHMTPPPKKKKI